MSRNKQDSQNENLNCVEFFENYNMTKESVDWLQCISCKKWYHETCSLYKSMCSVCGGAEKRAQKVKGNLYHSNNK